VGRFSRTLFALVHPRKYWLNSKLLRMLQNKPYNSPSIELYAEYSTLSTPDMHMLQLLLFVHKFMYHKHRLPSDFFRNYFELSMNVHDKHNSRESNDRHVTAINNKNLAVANRSRVSCAHNTLRHL